MLAIEIYRWPISDCNGHYVIAEPIELNDELTRFLVFADMLVNRSSYRTFLELQDVAELFPFACRVSKEELVADERFEVNNFGGEFSVGVRE